MSKSIPNKYRKIWYLAEPLLKAGRTGDMEHAQALVDSILGYSGKLKFDLDVLIPTAILHDIGHIAILPEHIKYVSGHQKIPNAKLLHMLTGSKIAKEILLEARYDKKKSAEIVEIISIHDMDQLSGFNTARFYNTRAKKIFHDFDALDRYNIDRIKRMAKLIGYKKKYWSDLQGMLNKFFFEEFRAVAEKNLKQLKKQ